MTKRLTPEEEKGLSPSQRLREWIRKFPDETERLRAALGYDKAEWPWILYGRVKSLREWLDRYQHSPRAQKKDWYRFLKNNIPKKGQGNGGRSHQTANRRSPGRFDRGSGEYSL